MTGNYYPQYDRTPLPIDFSKFPSHMRPTKSLWNRREVQKPTNSQSETEQWDDYLAQCEEREV